MDQLALSRRLVLGALASTLGLGLSSNARTQTAARTWTVTGTASTRSSGPENPYYVLANTSVQALVVTALQGPVTAQQVERALQGTDLTLAHLVGATVLKLVDGDRYALAFNVMAREDLTLLRHVSAPAGADLANAFLARRDAFEQILARYDLPHVRADVLAMAIVGCIILDWDGLDVTAEDGLRVPPIERPNGDKYLMSMIEVVPELSVRALYWGSHNRAVADGTVVFTTFGDHEAANRLGLPDIASRVSADDLSSETRPNVARQLAGMLTAELRSVQDDAARIMLRLRQGPVARADLTPVPAQRLLESLYYIRTIDGMCHAHVPVLTAEQDKDMLDAARALGRQIMRDWLTAHYGRIRSELTSLRSVQASVSYDVVFTQIWHDLFGWANYNLSRKGFFYDPYGPDAEWVSFAPFVWEAPLNLYAGTRIF